MALAEATTAFYRTSSIDVAKELVEMTGWIEEMKNLLASKNALLKELNKNKKNYTK